MATEKASDDLDPRLEIFCQRYLVDFNGTKAAQDAGYTKNPAAAAVQASRLLKNAKIRARLKELTTQQVKRLGFEVDADRTLQELTRVGESDLRRIFKEDGTMVPVHEWPDDIARAVASIEVNEIFEYEGGEKVWTGYCKKVKLWPKVHAQELLGKHKKLFTDRLEITDKSGLAEKMAAARKRASRK